MSLATISSSSPLAGLADAGRRPAGRGAARARGLRRGHMRAAPCPRAPLTPVVAAPSLEQIVAVLLPLKSGPRGLRVDLACDVAALCSYLHHVARTPRKGQPATSSLTTSSPALVAGLAAVYGWKLTGERYSDRDHHYRALVRWLRLGQQAGLWTYHGAVDEDGEDRCTHITLLPPPALALDEQAAARAWITARHARYGKRLATSAQIRPVPGRILAAPATKQARAGHRAFTRARARSMGSLHNGPTPYGVQPTVEQQPVVLSAHASYRDETLVASTGVTRTRVSAQNERSVATHQRPGHGLVTDEVFSASLRDPEGSWDPDGLLARVTTREAQRQDLHRLLAEHVSRRVALTAVWGLDREWPAAAIREAWAVARHGAQAVAQSAPPGPRPTPTQLHRLRAAVERAARYEQDAATATVAAFLTWATRHDSAQTCGGAITRYEQHTRQLRTQARRTQEQQLDRAHRRAQRRRQHAGGRLAYRRAAWPAWVAINPGDGLPELDHSTGRLVITSGHQAPPPSSNHYRLVQRDAILLAHHDNTTAAQLLAHIDEGLHRPQTPEPISQHEHQARAVAKALRLPIEQTRRMDPLLLADLAAQATRAARSVGAKSPGMEERW